MVQFFANENGFDVLIEGALFGYLQKDCGFCTDTNIEAKRIFFVVSPEDLIEIAIKADEVKKYGNVIPVCPHCKGTPNFPREIYSPNEGTVRCGGDLHTFYIRYFGKPGSQGRH